MSNKFKSELLKNKTAIVISSIESLSTHLGQVIQEYGANVHISDIDITEDTNIEKAIDKKEDFVLIYIRE